jgi:hypothetical protein
VTSRLRRFYLSYLSNPADDRPIYRLIGKRAASKILQIGVEDGVRAARMIEAAAGMCPVGRVEYTGIDLFEMADPQAGPTLNLKAAYCLLRPSGAKVRLVPGDPAVALGRVANEVRDVDLVLVSPRISDEAMQGAWFYLPRMLHERSVVLLSRRSEAQAMTLQQLDLPQVAQLAGRTHPRKAA